MMKTTISYLFLCFFISNAFSQSLRPRITVKIHNMQGYGQYEPFARAAAQRLEEVLNSELFEMEVVNTRYKHNRGMTSIEIYNHIIKAHEECGDGGQDNIVDLRLRTVNIEQDGKDWIKNCRLDSWAGTIGVDGSGTGIAAICPEWLQYYAEHNDTASLAGHFMHEYLHILGFTHPYPFKYRSVPYKIGNIVKAIINIKNE